RGTSGFGKLAVNGRNRTPLPPARMTAFTPEAAFLSLLIASDLLVPHLPTRFSLIPRANQTANGKIKITRYSSRRSEHIQPRSALPTSRWLPQDQSADRILVSIRLPR